MPICYSTPIDRDNTSTHIRLQQKEINEWPRPLKWVVLQLHAMARFHNVFGLKVQQRSKSFIIFNNCYSLIT